MNSLNQTQALYSLNSLRSEFERAAEAQCKRKLFHTWLGDSLQKYTLYNLSAQKLKEITGLITEGNTQTAVTELTSLKANFDFNAETYKSAAEETLLGRFGKAKAAEKRFQGYSKKIAAVLSLF